MYPKSNYTKKVKDRKLAAAANAVARARATLVSNRRSSYSGLRTGGFAGSYGRGRGNVPEVKTIDVTGNSTFSLAGAVVLLNGVAQGDDYNTRDGRKIWMKSHLLKVSFFPSTASSVNTGDICRILVVYDKQANGVAPTVANILQTAAWDSPINLDNRERFVVLNDKFYGIEASVYAAGVLTVGSPKARICKIFRRLYHDVQFSGTGATVGSISTGSVYMLTICANHGGATTFYYNSRIRFTGP